MTRHKTLKRLATAVSVLLITSVLLMGCSHVLSGVASSRGRLVMQDQSPPAASPRRTPAQDCDPSQPVAISTSAVLPLASHVVFGGNDEDVITDVYIADDRSVYVTGFTWGAGYPVTSGAYRTFSSGQYDAFATKWFPNGTVAYSTFIGGQLQDLAYGIEAHAGRAYVVGITESNNYTDNFYTSPDAYAGEINLGVPGNRNFDGFLVILNEQGTAIDYSTYFGSTGNDFIYDIEIDAEGLAWCVGNYEKDVSDDLPTTAGAWRGAYGGGPTDAFVCALNETGGLFYSSLIPGTGRDGSRSLVIYEDDSSITYGDVSVGVVGLTGSSNFHITAGAYDTLLAVGMNWYVMQHRVEQGSGHVDYSTLLGGGLTDSIFEYPQIDYLPDGDLFGIGGSVSTDLFPSTGGAPQPTRRGLNDGYLAWFAVSDAGQAGADLRGATFVGGSSQEHILDVEFGPRGQLLACGSTQSLNFPDVGYRSRSLDFGSSRDNFVTRHTVPVDFGMDYDFGTAYSVGQWDEVRAMAVEPWSEDVVAVATTTPTAATAPSGRLQFQQVARIKFAVPTHPVMNVTNIVSTEDSIYITANVTPSAETDGAEVDSVTLSLYFEDGVNYTFSANRSDPGVSNVYVAEYLVNRTENFVWEFVALTVDGGRASEDGFINFTAIEGDDGVPFSPPDGPGLEDVIDFFSEFGFTILALVVGTLVIAGSWVLGPAPKGTISIFAAGATFLLMGVATYSEIPHAWQYYSQIAYWGYVIVWSQVAGYYGATAGARGVPVAYQTVTVGLAIGAGIMSFLSFDIDAFELWPFAAYVIVAIAASIASLPGIETKAASIGFLISSGVVTLLTGGTDGGEGLLGGFTLF